jgi:hypothetical protein
MAREQRERSRWERFLDSSRRSRRSIRIRASDSRWLNLHGGLPLEVTENELRHVLIPFEMEDKAEGA